MILVILKLTLGLCFLFLGGSFLVRSCSSLSIFFKTKIFYISLFLLGIGTSAPELFVSIQSHLSSEPDLAIANIIGSNIFNILIITALIILSKTHFTNLIHIRKTTGLLLFSTLLIIPLLWDENLSRLDGLLFLGLFYLFLVQPLKEEIPLPSNSKALPFSLTIPFLIIGFALLFFGAQTIISSSTMLGSELGISRRIVGLFIVSIGTSLPELAIATVALFKKESEIALGGIVGSNIFNTFFIPSIVSFIRPLPVSKSFIILDGPFVILSTVLFFLAMWFHKKIPHWAISLFFLIVYCSYVYYVLSQRI